MTLKQSLASKAMWRNSIFRRHRLTRLKSKEFQKQKSEAMKRYWADPEWRTKTVEATMRATGKHPNMSEMQLGSTLDLAAPNEYRYVGNGSFTIGGRVPDFIHRKKKCLIELFGTYWHRGEDPSGRIDYFKRYGYDTLVVWESELTDVRRLSKRIQDFNGSGRPRFSVLIPTVPNQDGLNLDEMIKKAEMMRRVGCTWHEVGGVLEINESTLKSRCYKWRKAQEIS